MTENGFDPVFDEEISLRRFQVALKRSDLRLFEQALERLDAEISAKAPFSRHQAWQEFARTANDRETLPEVLKERLREALGRLLSVEARVAPAAASSEPEAQDDHVALVVGWQGGLDDPRVLAAFTAWVAEGGGGARPMLSRWLADGLGVGAIAHRANLAMAAAAAGLALADAPWTDTFFAGLAHALEVVTTPPLTRLAEALAGAPASVLTLDPGPAWGRHYPRGLDVLGLAGSLDVFACARCHHATSVAGAGFRPLSVACARCGAPAWPLVLPLDEPAYRPPAAVAMWERAAETLRRAGTWVIVEPPLPVGDLLAERLLPLLTPGKRVLVVADPRMPEVLDAWQAFLAPRAPRAVVTSRGPADEVLGFLLQGGVPELAAPGEGDKPTAFAPKKKTRR